MSAIANLARVSRATINTGAFIATLSIIQKYIIGIINVEGESMFPTMDRHDSNIVIQQKIAATSFMASGDVIILKSPTEPEALLCKRVVGLAGQTILPGPMEDGAADQQVLIPQGHMWVEGDNLPASVDSRHFGPVPIALTEGIVRLQLLPRLQTFTRETVSDRLQRLSSIEWPISKKTLVSVSSSDYNNNNKDFRAKWKWSNKIHKPHPDNPLEMIYDDVSSSQWVPSIDNSGSQSPPLFSDIPNNTLYDHLGSPTWYTDHMTQTANKTTTSSPYSSPSLTTPRDIPSLLPSRDRKL